MKLVLKDGTEIELSKGNNQSQFIVSAETATEIEPLLTADNLSDAHYEINGIVTETLKNKVISGSKHDHIACKVIFYITDSNNAEIERLKTITENQSTIIARLINLVDTLLVTTLEDIPIDNIPDNHEESDGDSDV